MTESTSLPPPAAFGVAAFGDSLTRGSSVETKYLSYLPAEWSASSRAKIGEFGLGGLARLSGAIPTLADADVEVVVLMWGTNDVYSGLYDDAWRDDLVAQLGTTLDDLIAAGITPVLVLPPPNLEPSPQALLANVRLAELAPLFEASAAERGVAYVDLLAAVLAEPDPAALFSDGVHWNEAGAAFAAQRIAPAIAPRYDAWLAEPAAP